MRIHRLLALLATSTLIACSDGGDNRPDRAPNFDFAPADAWIASFIDSQDVFDGAGFMVIHRDHGILHKAAFGTHEPDWIYLLASVSKVASVSLVMALADDEDLDFDLDTPIENYLPWMGAYPGVTAAQLLSNTSGIPGLLAQFNGGYGVHSCQYAAPGQAERSDSLAECGQAIYETRLDDTVPPGTLFDYGGSQWQLAGALAEVVGGDSWNNLFRKYIAEPCGLTVYEFGNMFADTSLWTGFPDSLVGRENPNIEGGGISNLEDVSTLLRMHLNDGLCDGGRVMSAASAQRMRADVGTALGSREWIGSAGRGYGLGWWVPPTGDGVEPTLFQDGGAFGSVTWIDTARDYGVFVALARYDDIFAARLGPLTINPGLTPVVNDIIDNPLP